PTDGEQPDNELREIEFKKNQYGPMGETITLRYQRGLFLPVAAMGSLDKMAADQAAENLFLELLDKFQAQGRNVSHSKTAHAYAPTMFAKDPKAKAPGISQRSRRRHGAAVHDKKDQGRKLRPAIQSPYAADTLHRREREVKRSAASPRPSCRPSCVHHASLMSIIQRPSLPSLPIRRDGRSVPHPYGVGIGSPQKQQMTASSICHRLDIDATH